MASAQGVGGGSNDLSCVYRAVDQGASAEQVRAILARGPRTRRAKQQWLQSVLEHKGGANNDETPLQRAHRRRDGPLVGVLLEHGADPCALGPNANALAICIAYGEVDSLRVLLRSGQHSAEERLASGPGATVAGADDPSEFCRPVHLCVAPPRLSEDDDDDDDFYPSPPQLDCLDVLVREFGADINKPDEPYRWTPLHWLGGVRPSHERRAFDALMALGADPHVPDRWGKTFIFDVRDPEVLQKLLARGVSPNVIAGDGKTPLITACHGRQAAIVSALLPVTTTKTRRAMVFNIRYSALDWLAAHMFADPPPPWMLRAIEELLSSRVPVQPHNAARLLPIAARLAERRSNQLARRNRSAAMQWRAHEDMVGLAFDFRT